MQNRNELARALLPAPAGFIKAAQVPPSVEYPEPDLDPVKLKDSLNLEGGLDNPPRPGPGISPVSEVEADEPDQNVGGMTPKPSALDKFLASLGGHTETLGGHVMGGVHSLLGALGATDWQTKAEEWGKDSGNKRLVGGGTAGIGAILVALALRKLLGGGGGQQYGGMFVRANLVPQTGLRDLIKRSYPEEMGTPIKPLKTEKSETATPRRRGVHGSNRERTHAKLKQKTLSSSGALGR